MLLEEDDREAAKLKESISHTNVHSTMDIHEEPIKQVELVVKPPAEEIVGESKLILNSRFNKVTVAQQILP